MALVPAKCSMCGSSIKVDNSSEKGICEHCGTEYITEKVINNHTTNYNVTNNITKVVNGKETDLEEEMFARALNHKKLGNIDDAKEILRDLTQKYPDVAQYHLHYALVMSDDFKRLFLEDPEISSPYKELDNFFKTAKKEELNAFCNDYGIEQTEDTTKIKESLLAYSQNAYVSKTLIPAYKNKTFAEEILNDEIKDYLYENILEKLNPENIKKAKKPAITYLKYIQGKSDSLELKEFEKETLTLEEENELEYYKNLANLLNRVHEKFELIDEGTSNQKTELKKLEEELEQAEEKAKRRKELIWSVILNLLISLAISVAVFIIAYFVGYAKNFNAGVTENKLSAPVKSAFTTALISMASTFVAIYLFKLIVFIKDKINDKLAPKKALKPQKTQKIQPENLKKQAESRLEKKIELQAVNKLIVNDLAKYKSLVNLEMEKIKKERKVKK